MRLRWLLVAAFVACVGGCQGPPPTVIYVVISPTPAPEIEATAEATPQVEATLEATEVAALPTASPTAQASPSADAAVTAQVVSSVPTDLPPNFPTPVNLQIQVAEQLFERGRMFWLQPTGEIWVLVIAGEGRGTWSAYPDTFADGEPESDPSLTPPSGLYQPVRGFGKLWREATGVRDALGWAATQELGYQSAYEYHAGGAVNAAGVYVPGPGYHILYSLYGERFRFDEVAGTSGGTWQLGG